MKYALILVAFLAGCINKPFIVPDTSGETMTIAAMRDSINQPGAPDASYGWLFWYLPVVLLASFWGYREFIRRPVLCEENGQEVEKDEKETKNTPTNGV